MIMSVAMARLQSVTRWMAVCLMLGSVMCNVLHAQTDAPATGIYTCVDAKGRKLTSDRLIPECTDREQKMLNPSGTLKAKIGPTLSAQEVSQIDIKNKAELVERARQDEEKRRDRALLVRYPTQSAHEKERSEALAHVARVKQTSVARVTQLLDDRAKLTDEMAFYQKNPSKAPPKLRQRVDEVSQSLAAQGRFLAEQDEESRRINTRFDEELLRLAPLWHMSSAAHR